MSIGVLPTISPGAFTLIQAMFFDLLFLVLSEICTPSAEISPSLVRTFFHIGIFSSLLNSFIAFAPASTHRIAIVFGGLYSPSFSTFLASSISNVIFLMFSSISFSVSVFLPMTFATSQYLLPLYSSWIILNWAIEFTGSLIFLSPVSTSPLHV